MSDPKYLTVCCGFCPWRDTYSYHSDQNPELSARQLLRDHIGDAHGIEAVAVFDDFVARHSLNVNTESEWLKATRVGRT